MNAQRAVWRIDKAGDITDLRLLNDDLADLASDMVRVQVQAVGLNFADIFALTGLYSATPKGAFIPGLEFSGIVIDNRDAQSQLNVGDRVMGCIRFGAYATVVDVAASQLTRLPDDWSFAQGAAFLVQTFTAWYALRELGNVKAGQLALIHSAAGGVGLQALQLCKAFGVNVIGSVGDATKQQWLRQQGWREVIIRDAQFADNLQHAIGERELRVVLDGVGGKTQQQSFEALAPCGRLIVFGAAEFTPGKRRPNWMKIAWRYFRRPRYEVLNMISANKSVMAFNLIWLWQKRELFDQMNRELAVLHLPPPHIGHRDDFTQAAEAIEKLRSGTSFGKIVLMLNEH